MVFEEGTIKDLVVNSEIVVSSARSGLRRPSGSSYLHSACPVTFLQQRHQPGPPNSGQ